MIPLPVGTVKERVSPATFDPMVTVAPEIRVSSTSVMRMLLSMTVAAPFSV